MTQEFTKGSTAMASGAATGWGVTTVFGNVGVAAGGTAFSVGAVPIVGAGAVAGAAAYGAYRGLSEGDPIAFGSVGLGAAAGASISAGIGGVGVVGGLGGVGLGLGTMSAMGGIAGLGLYGVVKMLDSGPRESAFGAFSRMEEKLEDEVAYLIAYNTAMLELSLPKEDELLKKMLDYEVDAELQALKEAMASTDPSADLPHRTFDDASKKTKSNSASNDSTKEKSAEVVLDSGSWVKLHQLHPHQAAINDVAIHPHEPYLFIASDDGDNSYVNLKTGQREHTFFSQKTTLAIAFNPNNNTLLTGGESGFLRNWNVNTQQFIESLSPEKLQPGQSRLICSITAGHQGKLFASAGSDRTVTLWCKHELHRNRYRTRRHLIGHTDTIFSVAFTPDDRYLISASADATIRVWDLGSWDSPRILQGHEGSVNRAIVCPTYPLLVSAGQDATLRFWDLETGTLLKTVVAHKDAIRFLAFSPDGTQLVSSGNDGLTKIWRITDQETYDANNNNEPLRDLDITREATLKGCGPILFDASGRVLIMGDRSGKITLWHNPTHESILESCTG